MRSHEQSLYMAGFVIIHLPCYLQSFTWDKSKNNLFGYIADIVIAGLNEAQWLDFGRLKNQMTAPQPTVFTNSHLYDQDFYLWIETTAKQLKEGRFSEVDLENLIEEIKCLGRSEKQGLASNLVVLLMHLLKYKYQPEKRSNSWKGTIREHRRRLTITFKDSPSLKPYFQEVLPECYQDARKQASDETGLSLDTFPLESPFTADECLDEEFLPD